MYGVSNVTDYSTVEISALLMNALFNGWHIVHCKAIFIVNVRIEHFFGPLLFIDSKYGHKICCILHSWTDVWRVLQVSSIQKTSLKYLWR